VESEEGIEDSVSVSALTEYLTYEEDCGYVKYACGEKMDTSC